MKRINIISRLVQLTLFLGIGILTLSSRPPLPGKMDLYLLIGQSNMAGRGELTDSMSTENPNIWVVNAQSEWIPAKDPLHFDKPKSVGVGPGLAFAQELASTDPDVSIGLIPCAVGGSGIDDWQPGSKHDQTGIYPYDAMLDRVRLAQKHGKIKAILWHQGESDSTPEKSEVYKEKLTAFFIRLRHDLKAQKTPILVGTLGDFYVKKNPTGQVINKIVNQYVRSNKNVYVVSSTGLTDKGDTTHFDAKSARELGKRYARELLSIEAK